jgi:riboflavin synthase
MFTGLVEALAEVAESTPRGGDISLRLRCPTDFMQGMKTGDSVSVSGVCLTALDITENSFAADVSLETLRLTSLGHAQIGSQVNLERALLPSTRMGGHFVSGHVDGLGHLRARQPEGRSERWEFSAPAQLLRFIAVKGSICVDGVSLTVNAVDDAGFTVNLIPHTLSHTTLGQRRIGDPVNLEVDLIARYVARLQEQQ